MEGKAINHSVEMVLHHKNIIDLLVLWLIHISLSLNTRSTLKLPLRHPHITNFCASFCYSHANSMGSIVFIFGVVCVYIYIWRQHFIQSTRQG